MRKRRGKTEGREREQHVFAMKREREGVEAFVKVMEDMKMERTLEGAERQEREAEERKKEKAVKQEIDRVRSARIGRRSVLQIVQSAFASFCFSFLFLFPSHFPLSLLFFVLAPKVKIAAFWEL